MSREVHPDLGGTEGEVPLVYSTLEFSNLVRLYFGYVTHTKQR